MRCSEGPFTLQLSGRAALSWPQCSCAPSCSLLDTNNQVLYIPHMQQDKQLVEQISFDIGPTVTLCLVNANSKPAGGRGASVSACADLTNQLQCCWVDPACA